MLLLALIINHASGRRGFFLLTHCLVVRTAMAILSVKEILFPAVHEISFGLKWKNEKSRNTVKVP